MRLRTNIRPPGRYRENDDDDYLPPNPIFAHSTVPFDPNARPAVFPSLEFNETLADRERSVKEREKLREKEKGKGKEIERPARVLRDQRIVPIMEMNGDIMQMPNGRWVSTLGDPGVFDPYAVGFSDDEEENQAEERWIPPVFTQPKYWSDLSNGMRLIVIRELTDHMDFEDVVAFLQLEDKEFDDFIALCADEIQIREEAEERDARVQERQSEWMESGDRDEDAFGRIFDEEAARDDMRMSAMWKFTSEEVHVAKSFLGNYRFREEFDEAPDIDIEEVNKVPPFEVLSAIQNRLLSYIGVETNYASMEMGIDFRAYLPSTPARDEVEGMPELGDGSLNGNPFGHHSFPAPAQNTSRPANPPPTAIFNTANAPSKPSKKSTPKKNIERDGIENELMKQSPKKRGRPPNKADKITKGPSRLREVTNASEIETPHQSPKDNAQTALNPLFDLALQRPFSPAPIGIKNLARSPFQQFSSPSPAPKHSASFRDDLPAQPASTSPSKGLSRPEASGTALENALGIQMSPVVKDAVRVRDAQGAAPVVENTPKAQSVQNIPNLQAVPSVPNVQATPIAHASPIHQSTPIVQDAPVAQATSVNESAPVIQDVHGAQASTIIQNVQHNPMVMASSRIEATSAFQSTPNDKLAQQTGTFAVPKPSMHPAPISSAKPVAKQPVFQSTIKYENTPSPFPGINAPGMSNNRPSPIPAAYQSTDGHWPYAPTLVSTSMTAPTTPGGNNSFAQLPVSRSDQALPGSMVLSASNSDFGTNHASQPNKIYDPRPLQFNDWRIQGAPPLEAPNAHHPSGSSGAAKRSFKQNPKIPAQSGASRALQGNPTRIFDAFAQPNVSGALQANPQKAPSDTPPSSTIGSFQGNHTENLHAHPRPSVSGALQGKPKNDTFAPSQLSPSGAFQGKRVHDGADVAVEYVAKKPRLEQQPDKAQRNMVGSILDSVGANGTHAAAVQVQTSQPVAQLNVSGATNVSRPQTPTKNLDFKQYSPSRSRPSPSKSRHASPSKSVARGGEAAASSSSAMDIDSAAFHTPSKSFESNADLSGRMNASVDPHTPVRNMQAAPETSGRRDESVEPQTPTVTVDCGNPPKRPRKQFTSKAAAAKAAGPAILQEAAQVVDEQEAAQEVDESKKLGAPPPIIEEKTRSAAKHARTASQSSSGSVDLLQTNSSNPVESSGDSRLQQTPDPSKTRVEVQIPAQKRSASQVPPETFERAGSPAKKLKIRAATSSARSKDGPGPMQPDTEMAAPAEAGVKKKGPTQRQMKKPMSRATSKAPTASEDEGSVAGSVAEPSMHDPPAPGKGSKRKIAAATPKAPPKSKTPQPKIAPPPRPNSQAAAPKATAPKATAPKKVASKAKAPKVPATKAKAAKARKKATAEDDE